MTARTLNRSLKTWPGWAALVVVLMALLAVGSVRDSGPRTPAERIDDIARRVACPVCDGESVFESRNTASLNIRSEITAQVFDGVRSDTEIIAFIADRYGGQVLLVPRSTGVEALVWAIPAAAFVIGCAALVMVFRRWSREAAAATGATAADYELVAAALAEERSGQAGVLDRSVDDRSLDDRSLDDRSLDDGAESR